MIIKYQKGGKITDDLSLSLIDKAIITKQLTVHHSEVTNFARRCRSVSKETLAKEVGELIRGKPLFYKKNEYIQANSSTGYIIKDNWSWSTCLLFYVLFNSTNREVDYRRTKNFIEQFRLNIQTIHAEVYRHSSNLTSLYGELQNGNEFFSVDLFLRELRKQKVRYAIEENKLLLFFNNVTIKDNNGEISYKEIILKIEEWRITGFALRFEHFDYFSSSHQPVELHPLLHPTRLPYLANSVLWWCIPDYKLYIEAIKNHVYAEGVHRGQHIAGLHNIVTHYNDLRRLWGGLRVAYKNRSELSDKIFQNYLK